MPSYKNSIHLPHPNAPLLGSSSPHLDQEDGSVVADSCISPGRVAAFAQRNPNQFSAEAFTDDDFRMYEFKVRRCMRGRSHVWTNCPFAHPGEKARRRDPQKFLYSGEPCPDFRHGSCQRGNACGYAHGVFEHWLHPSRYRTELCKDGKACRRKVCFFAHSMRQLRHVDVPVEELHAEGAETMDSHASEMYARAHEVWLPMGADFSENSRVHMVDLSKHEVGLSVAKNPSVLIPGDMYDNVGSISETLPMLMVSSQALPSSNSHTKHMSEHLLYTSGSPPWAQAVARQSFLMHEGYGLSSPTSTLAGPLYLSPFSSPPLSPLSTPYGWIPLCNSNSNGTSRGGVSQVMSDNMREMKVCDHFGEEGLAENAMPDLGWVCELVM